MVLSPGFLLNRRYRVVRMLGQGGMGDVYQAEDIDLNNRIVAIKEMSQAGLAPAELAEAIKLFQQEANLLSKLNHPNLPDIYAHFENNQRWYLVMKFIEGMALEKHLEKAPGNHLPVREVLQIGIQLATALGYLHTRQPPIIFRDLKPSNVMLTSDGHLYLIDFGIARLFKPGQIKDTIALGTPGYAAPEQRGMAQTTAQSDIYSLGALLHQMLTGIDPSLSTQGFPPLPATVPPGLTSLIMQMVKVRMNERPASMAAIKQELQRIVDDVAAQQKSAGPQVPVQPVAQFSPVLPPLLALTPGSTILTYNSHIGTVDCVAWSPDGKRIASGSRDGTVQVWDANNGMNLLTYTGHRNWVASVAWSPDGTRIASGGEDGTVQVWDANTGRTIFTYTGGHEGLGRAKAAWSPDGKHIASGGYSVAYVWDASTGRTISTYPGHSTQVLFIAWSPDGTRIASGTRTVYMQVWDANSGRNLITYRGLKVDNDRGYTTQINCIAWSPDGKRIASGGYDAVQVWDANSEKHILTHNGLNGYIARLTWSPDGKRIASAGKAVQVWDASSGDHILSYTGHGDYFAWSVAWSPDGTRIASGSPDHTVQVWVAPK